MQARAALFEDMTGNTNIFERHFSPKTLAELWGFSEDTIVRWFADEPGVLKSQPAAYNGRKRTRCEIRIPESIALRVYEKRVNKKAA